MLLASSTSMQCDFVKELSILRHIITILEWHLVRLASFWFIRNISWIIFYRHVALTARKVLEVEEDQGTSLAVFDVWPQVIQKLTVWRKVYICFIRYLFWTKKSGPKWEEKEAVTRLVPIMLYPTSDFCWVLRKKVSVVRAREEHPNICLGWNRSKRLHLFCLHSTLFRTGQLPGRIMDSPVSHDRKHLLNSGRAFALLLPAPEKEKELKRKTNGRDLEEEWYHKDLQRNALFFPASEEINATLHFLDLARNVKVENKAVTFDSLQISPELYLASGNEKKWLPLSLGRKFA